MIRAVLFDLDETLIPEDKPLALAYGAVVRGDVAEFRAGLRARWQRDAPCPEYRARVQVSASDGLIASFAGDGPELAAIASDLQRRKLALAGLEEHFDVV